MRVVSALAFAFIFYIKSFGFGLTSVAIIYFHLLIKIASLKIAFEANLNIY